jgi:restriction system protein
MGYEVFVTQQSHDGGVDVEATRDEPGVRELVLIQCKRYTRAVGVSAVRELTGIVAQRHANKGVIAVLVRSGLIISPNSVGHSITWTERF